MRRYNAFKDLDDVIDSEIRNNFDYEEIKKMLTESEWEKILIKVRRIKEKEDGKYSTISKS